MSEARILSAIDRIEKALARIETQAALSGGSGSSGDLAEKHDTLRRQVTASLAELDTLIGEMER